MSLYTKIIDLQKLRLAWKQVYKNKPREGVDRISCEEFEADRENQLKLLNVQLRDHAWQCQPVQMIPLYRGEKVRYISLYCMRDKVVQNSVAAELSLIYESSFSPCCYAYRNGKSAQQAAQDILEFTRKQTARYVLKTDIHSFFDHIRHERLFAELRKRLREEDVLELIRSIICAPSMEKDGTLTEKRTGLYQGASISPILSNVYLMQMDQKVEQEVLFYVRYSDDLLLFFDSRENAEAYLSRLSLYLEGLNLRLSTEKTEIIRIADGFEFLGYHFADGGMTAPDKAREQLQTRLETVWLDQTLSSFEERMKKALEIASGWEQYYPDEDIPGGILDYTVRIYRAKMAGKLEPDKMSLLRAGLENPYKDVMRYLVSVWQECQRPLQALREYESYYEMPELWEEPSEAGTTSETISSVVKELLTVYAQYAVQESEETRTELIQLYTDLKKYRNAAAFTAIAQKVRKPTVQNVFSADKPVDSEVTAVTLNQKQMERFMELFVGREDLYALNELADRNRRVCEDVLAPLYPEVVTSHLTGEKTVSTYIQRTNATVKSLIIDIDISKAVFLKNEPELLPEYMKKCLDLARKYMTELRHMGMSGYLEKSGCRGYHLWVFFTEWLPVRYVNLLTDLLETRLGSLWHESGIQIEYFPNKTRVRAEKKGQCIKLPWGIHPKTGKRSYFIDDSGSAVQPQSAILDDIVCCSLHTLKRVVASREDSSRQAGKFTPEQSKIEVDSDLSGFGTLSDSVKAVLESCNLMRYLCQKARTSHYLTHFERQSVLYVFAHLGEEGKDFVHQVMAYTLNYSESITEKFITRCPEKPISCIKLREQYRQLSAEIGCTCSFRRTKNCYPSPVLHALKKSDENSSVTMPTSRTLPAEKQTLLKNEINVGVRAQEIAEKLIELRKQRRSLDKAARKCEQDLERIFDDNKTDCMEIKMGLLVRRKKGEGSEWSIEL